MDDAEVESRFRELVSRLGSPVALAERTPVVAYRRRPVRALPLAPPFRPGHSPTVVVLRLTAAISMLGMLGLGLAIAPRGGLLLWMAWLLVVVPAVALLAVLAVGWLLARVGGSST